jgi:hypothetical protein
MIRAASRLPAPNVIAFFPAISLPSLRINHRAIDAPQPFQIVLRSYTFVLPWGLGEPSPRLYARREGGDPFWIEPFYAASRGTEREAKWLN